MGKFKYKFDSVRHVKETQKKIVQKDVALIELEIEKYTGKLNAIIDEERASKNNRFKQSLRAGDVQFKINYEINLDEQRKQLQEIIDNLKRKKEKKIEVLTQKTKEQKIFDTLEDIYHDEFIKEEKRLDLINIDELATQKFIRNKK